MKFGYLEDVIQSDHWIFGDNQLQGDVLQPNGQWDAYVPIDEFQNVNGIETFACTIFGTWNSYETLLRRLFGQIDNLSDRYTAKIAGTTQNGNSPHTVAECIRTKGGVNEADWPFSPDITSFEQFYAEPPTALSQKAGQLLLEFDFNHDWVPNDVESMKAALRYSPLGVSTGWNSIDENGYWFKTGDAPDSHWIMCYGFVEGKYWKCFDSYSNTHKMRRWDDLPQRIKRYSIKPSTRSQQISLYQQLISVLKKLLYALSR